MKNMNDITVTREMLVADKACAPAIYTFDLAFPGGSATLQEIVDHELCEPDWLGWLAVNASFVTEDIGMELIPLSGNPGKYYGEAAVHAHWVTAETGPRLIMLSDNPRLTFGRASATIYAEWMTPEIKAELIAKYGD